MPSCAICLGELSADAPYHAECIESLFGTSSLPKLVIDLSKLYALAASKMAGKMSISGAQEKVSLTLSSDRRTLDVSATGGRYILKPETSRFSAIPKNEHLTMRLAQMLSIETPPFGLLRQDPGGMPYIIRRFDRLDDGTKLQVEDFCQLAGKRVKDKYEGSAELCVKLLKKYATEPLIEIQKFYRLILFCWWAENGDMHLKNFSLLTTPEGIRRLSPAYDLVCTKLVIPDDTLAMPVGGRDRKLTRGIWVEFADYCGIPDKAAKRLISEQIDSLDPALRLISASFLPESMKNQYEALIRANTAILAS